MFSEITFTTEEISPRCKLVFLFCKILYLIIFFRVMTSKSFEVFEIEDVKFGPISRKLNFRIHLQFFFYQMSQRRQ